MAIKFEFAVYCKTSDLIFKILINSYVYFVHIDLAHSYKKFGLEQYMGLAQYVALSLAPLNIIGHGMILYQKLRLKSMLIPTYSTMY